MVKREWYYHTIMNTIISALIFVIDRTSKTWALNHNGASYRPFFMIDVTFNRGFSWSFAASENTLVFALVTAIITFITTWTFYMALHSSDNHTKTAYFIIGAGSCSNIFDRIYYGGVIDFIAPLPWYGFKFAIFNVADICIVSGILFLFYLQLFRTKEVQ